MTSLDDQLNAFLNSAAGQQSGSAPEDEAEDTEAGLQTPQQVQQLSQLSGPAFDTQWKQALLALQQGAKQLSGTEQEEGSAQQMRELAAEFVAEEQAATAKLNKLG